MTPTPEVQQRIRRYLLGQLSDGAREELEQDLLANAELFEELLVAEDEIIDDYLGGKLSDTERASFETHFLATPERHEKLKFGRAFDRYLSSQVSEPPVQPLTPSRNQRGLEMLRSSQQGSPRSTYARAFFSSPLRVAVLALVVLVLAFTGWRVFFHQSDVDKGLLALNAAYREQRPLEARISGLDYAPFSQTRGPEADRVNKTDLQRAELTLLEALRNKPTPAVHHALGEVYLAKKQFDDAIKEFDEALKSDPKNAQLYSDLGAAWLEKGRMDRDGKEPGKGMEELGRSLESLTKALESNPDLLEALFNRALCHQYIMLPQQAGADWREYLKRDSTSSWADEASRNLQRIEEQKNKASRTKGQLLTDFLSAYESRNDDAAWAALSQGRERAGNLIVEGLIDEYLILAASDRVVERNDRLQRISYAGQIESTRVGDWFNIDRSRFYEKTNAVQRERIRQARDLMKDGYMRYLKSESEAAIGLYSKARDMFVTSGDKCDLLIAEIWLGNCYLRIPDAKKGFQAFDEICRTVEVKNYRLLFVQSLLAMSDARSSMNEFSQSLDYAKRALALAEQIYDNVSIIRALQTSVSTHLTLNDYDESLSSIPRALILTDSGTPDPKLKWPFYHEAALNFCFLELPAVALEFETEALRLAEASVVPLLISRSYERLGLAYEKLGNYPEAQRNAERAFAEGEKISSELSRMNVMAHSALLLGKLSRESGEPSRAVVRYDQALELYKRLNLDIYLYEAHKGRLLALIELKQDEAAEAELETVMSLFEEYRTKIAEESYRDKFFDAGQNTYDLATYFEYFRRKNTAKAFAYAETSRARSLLSLLNKGGHDATIIETKHGSATPLPLAEIQQRLSEQAQLLQYAVLDDHVVIWVITKNGVTSADTSIKSGELDREIRDFLGALSAPEGRVSEVVGLGRKLYGELITPVDRLLDRNRQLCIIPDKALNFLPFGALVSPLSDRYLIEDHVLEIAPSATVFVASSERARARERAYSEKLLSVGDPDFDRIQFPNLSELPGSRREAEQIATYYGAHALLGETATKESVKQALKDADVIHLATHALSDERSPLLSKLLLAKARNRANPTSDGEDPEGFLLASEIYEMNLPRTRLVILSACRTGIERAYRGEGAIGLARPFIAAGVPLVIASLWAVDSEATADLMISFHKHRKQDHVSTVEALHRAQLESLQKPQPESGRNYGWAAFVAIGGYAEF